MKEVLFNLKECNQEWNARHQVLESFECNLPRVLQTVSHRGVRGTGGSEGGTESSNPLFTPPPTHLIASLGIVLSESHLFFFFFKN